MASEEKVSDAASMRVVICGAGAIGSSIAYHLTLRGVKPILVERCKVAAAGLKKFLLKKKKKKKKN